MVTITATAPTVYQLSSIRAFGFECQTNPDGSFSFCKEFATKEEARKALIERAEYFYNRGEIFESEEEFNQAIEDIYEYGTLTIDAVTARIS